MTRAARSTRGRRTVLALAVLLPALLLSSALALTQGTVRIPLARAMAALLPSLFAEPSAPSTAGSSAREADRSRPGLSAGGRPERAAGVPAEGASDKAARSFEATVLREIRLPRICLALLVGAALALAGCGFQGVLRNPLAEPYLLGSSSGAAVGAVLCLGLGLFAGHPFFVQAFSFAGGLLSLFLVLALARRAGGNRAHSLILAGVLMNAFLGAVLSLLLALNPDKNAQMIFWLTGSLALKGWGACGLLLPFLLAGLVLLLSSSRAMNLLELGEAQALHTGVPVARFRLLVLVSASLLTAACVSICGMVGFIGLMVPHMLRLGLGPDYRLLTALSPLLGGLLVLWADTAARLLFAPAEIPLGVVTAFTGVPFFAFLLLRGQKGHPAREGGA